MTLAITIAVALPLLLLLWFLAVRRYYRTNTSADEVHHLDTADGFGVALSRYRPRAEPKRHPVVLCGGLAANRYTYDLGPHRSLACYLAERGFDVWVMELRAHGLSRARWLPTFRWCLDEHAEHDVPSAIARVRELTSADDVHFVGHSLGGILLYVHLSRSGGAVRSGIAIGASLDYSGSPSWFHRVKRLVWLRYAIMAVPIGFFSALTAPLAARGPSKLDEFNIHYTNVEPADYRRLTAIGFHTVSSRVLAQLATAFHRGGLCSWDRGIEYIDGLSAVDTPVLAVAGTVDRQCPPDAARRTVDALGCDDKRLAVFGLAHGHADEYAHFDLLMGKRAREEVFPLLADWLEARD